MRRPVRQPGAPLDGGHRERGSALVLAAATTAALALAAAVLLLAATAAYRIASHRWAGAQALHLATAALDLAEERLASGAVALPDPDDPGAASWRERLTLAMPPPAPRLRQAAARISGSSADPASDAPPGAEVEIRLVIGPDGEPRVEEDGGRRRTLVHLEATGTFREGRQRLWRRLAVAVGAS